MTEFRNGNGNLLIITEINGNLIASYNGEERFELDGFEFSRVVAATPVPADEYDTLYEPDASQWIVWDGISNPVPHDQRVQYRLRDGREYENKAGRLNWKRIGSEFDIVAYRLIDPPALPAEPAPTEHDWQEWTGGECPFLVNEQIMVRLRNGETQKIRSSKMRWDHKSEDNIWHNYDIIAFKRL